MYQGLVQSQNYVTKRQSLKLLGEILLDRANFNVMTRYISSKENLQMVMNTLRDRSKNIQFEAFHVFKVSRATAALPQALLMMIPARLQVFVANPNKPPPITAVLTNNKDRLLVFLREFHNDRDGERPCTSRNRTRV